MAGLPPKPPPTLPANQTLYVSHLPDKIQKQDLRRELYILFATYGSILDIVAMKTMKMRGQAHITYKDVATAARAMRELQGFEFFGQEIRIAYAKSKSNTLALLDGTFNVPKPAAEVAAEHKPTSLQQSIFNNPSAASSGLPSKPAPSLKPTTSETAPKSPLGKRSRDDEEGSDASMSEDDDAMQMDESDED